MPAQVFSRATLDRVQDPGTVVSNVSHQREAGLTGHGCVKIYSRRPAPNRSGSAIDTGVAGIGRPGHRASLPGSSRRKLSAHLYVFAGELPAGPVRDYPIVA